MNDMAWAAPAAAHFVNDDGADAPARDIRKGAMIGAAFFVGLLGFAALTPLDAGATAEGVAVRGIPAASSARSAARRPPAWRARRSASVRPRPSKTAARKRS